PGKTSEGKTRNAANTRIAILEAARNRFLQDGYDSAGLRAIAADAGIDAALISRYFGSKKQLFAEVLESTREESKDLFTGDRTSWGYRLAEKMLDPTNRSAQHMIFIGLVTSSSSSVEASNLVHRHVEKHFMKPFAEWLGGPAAADTAWLMASMLMGVLVMNSIAPDKNIGIRLGGLFQGIIDSN